MPGTIINPTRMELKKIQARYTTARRGHKLLKDKRDELMKKFLEVVREDKVLRERVEAALAQFQGSFGIASATASPLMDMLGTGGADSYNYGMAFTSGELDASLAALNGILEDLVRLAELEKTAQMLAEEIERTRRRVNALEYIMMPRYLETIKAIRMKLDENERGNTTRLMKVKDMMLQAQLQAAHPDREQP